MARLASPLTEYWIAPWGNFTDRERATIPQLAFDDDRM
jgi:hypothetical protein